MEKYSLLNYQALDGDKLLQEVVERKVALQNERRILDMDKIASTFDNELHKVLTDTMRTTNNKYENEKSQQNTIVNKTSDNVSERIESLQKGLSMLQQEKIKRQENNDDFIEKMRAKVNKSLKEKDVLTQEIRADALMKIEARKQAQEHK